MSNLAFNAGYTDVMHLTLNMETRIMDESRELFEDRTVDDITVRLHVDEAGKNCSMLKVPPPGVRYRGRIAKGILQGKYCGMDLCHGRLVFIGGYRSTYTGMGGVF